MSAIARHMDDDNGLKIILKAIATMADAEHWQLEDCLNRLRGQWSESVEQYQTQVDSLQADIATINAERDKLLRELAQTQEAYRVYRQSDEHPDGKEVD